MKGHGAKFERKSEEAIVALLTQSSIDAAAKSVGISATTLIAWTKVPEFQKGYREARRAAFQQSIGRLQQGASAAATTLIKLLLDPNTPATVKARVSDSILHHAAKAMEIEDIETRVTELERTAELANSPGR